jgi:hypothetical protein
VIAAALVTATLISEAAASDRELDFYFLKFGQRRNAVVEILGPPDAESRAETLSFKHHRLIWLDQDGRKYAASFLNDRLFRWKTCTAQTRGCD